MPSWCLSFHAGYTCQRSGACCTAGWPIPIDGGRAAALRRLSAPRNGSGRPAPSMFVEDADARAGMTLNSGADGACVFYSAGDGLCGIQRDAGTALMPVACRNFPRVTLRDPRGTFITLSHYCPTAAQLLLAAGDIRRVEAPASLSLDGTVEGLDATDVLPPLLRPGMLMDLYGYSAWERHSLEVLNDDALSPRRALSIIEEATDDASTWQPGHQCLEGRMLEAFERARDGGAVPEDERGPLDRPVKAFLAAHLFASWSAYQGGGLTGVVESVHRALQLLGNDVRDAASFIAAVRASDLQLRHLEHVPTRSLSPIRHD